jgi:Putative porin
LIINYLYKDTLQTCKALKTLQVLFMVFFVCLVLPVCLKAQRPPAGVGGNSSSYPASTSPQSPSLDSIPKDEEGELENDTAHIVYFFADNLGRFYTEKDSLLDNFFQQYDPARKRQWDYFNLGFPTSAAYPSVYQPTMHRGLDIGLHAYDIYHIKNNDIRFFQQTKPFGDFSTVIAGKNSSGLSGRLSRNFANGVNFSFEMRVIGNINQRNEEGPLFNRKLTNAIPQTWLYEGFPRGKNSAVGVGIWKHSEKYDGFFTLTTNYVSQFDQGGILNDSLLKKITPTETLFGRLSGATTRHEKTEISYLQYLKLNKKDSTGTKRNYLATHQIAYKSAFYKVTDPFSTTTLQADTGYYGTLFNDIRGVRFFLKEKQLENSFNLSTTKARVSADSTKKVLGQNDWFEIGISHSFHHLDWESSKKNINNIIVKGRWNFTPNDNVKVETYAHLNILGYNVGDYRLSGEMFYNLKNIGSLTVKGVNQLYEPFFIQNTLYLTQKPVWDNEKTFKKILETNITGTLAIPRLNFEGTVAYTLLNNFVYFDKTYKPQQGTAPLSILQLILSENLKLGAFHLDNTVIVQKPTEKYLRLPDFFTKNSFYVEGKVFKKAMLSRVGFDFRYNSSWFAPSYVPTIGQFFVQETGKVKAYPALDAFISFKVRTFRLFVKMDNLVGRFSKDVYFQIYNYPVPDRRVWLGVRWQLVN